MLEEIKEELRGRLSLLRGDRNVHTITMKDFDEEELVRLSVGQVLKAAEGQSTMVDLAVSLGHRIRQKLGEKRNTVAACHAGFFVVISYLELGLIEYYLSKPKKKGKRAKYQAYHVRVKDAEKLRALWSQLTEDGGHVEVFPYTEKPAPWVSGLHATGFPLIRKGDSYILSKINPEEDAFILETLNRLGSTGWRINASVFDTFKRLKEDTTGPFRYHRETDEAKRQSLKIEMDFIEMVAERVRDTVHYNLWSYDFR